MKLTLVCRVLSLCMNAALLRNQIARIVLSFVYSGKPNLSRNWQSEKRSRDTPRDSIRALIGPRRGSIRRLRRLKLTRLILDHRDETLTQIRATNSPPRFNLRIPTSELASDRSLCWNAAKTPLNHILQGFSPELVFFTLPSTFGGRNGW